MPQINRIRVNNVKYNFGTQYYDDFMMRFSGKNTIYDLANGGGKSLLMLLLMQNMIPNCTLDEKQPIEKLFRGDSGNTAIHSLIEWNLDPCFRKDNFKYMLTGFCARKARTGAGDEAASQNQDGVQEAGGRTSASIEYFNYVIFYREFGENDIKNLPLSKDGRRITYQELKDYLRDLEKRDFNVSVKIFDRKGDYQNFISRYGIYESEWEIIRGINKTEGHVRTYFESNYRTSRKVVEDLLIEEIIQKSFHNSLGVEDDDDRMAKTLLDIKDKLVELSKKHGQMSNYDAQAESLSEFAKGMSDFKNIYKNKQENQKKLILMLAMARKQEEQAGKESEQLAAAIERIRIEKEREHKLVDTAEVLEQKVSLNEVKELLDETGRTKAEIIKESADLRNMLTLKECVADYREYQEYKKQLNEISQIIENRLRDHGDITDEMHRLAAVRKLQDEKQRRILRENLEEAKSLADSEARTLSSLEEEQRKLDADISMAYGRIEILKSEIAECESELKTELDKGVVLVAENAETELKNSEEQLEKDEKCVKNLKNDLTGCQNKLLTCRMNLNRTEASIEVTKEIIHQLENDLADEQNAGGALDDLMRVYSSDTVQGLVQTTESALKRVQSQVRELEERIRKAGNYMEAIKKGRYECDGEQYSKVQEYLVSQYGDDVVTGAQWYASLNQGQKRDINKRVPFVHYGFVIKNDFERIKADTALQEFDGSYSIPVISENVLYDMKLEVNTELVAFAAKNLSFLTDIGRVQNEIKKCSEELEEWETELSRLKDREKVIGEDYNLALRESVRQSLKGMNLAEKLEEKRSELEKLMSKRAELIDSENRLSQRESELGKSAADAQERLLETKKCREELLKVKELDNRLNTYLQKLAEFENNAADGKKKLEESKALAEPVRVRAEAYRSKAATIASKLDRIDTEWNAFAAYYKEDVQPDESNEYSEEELESRFFALKTIVEKDTKDITDKEKLRTHFEASMEKCLRAIAYRQMTIEEVADALSKDAMMDTDDDELMSIKEKLSVYDRKLSDADRRLESQSALYNRLDGSIAHGIHQIEEKYGSYEELECANPTSFKEQHRALIAKLSDNGKRLEEKQKSMQKDFAELRIMTRDMERIIRNSGIDADNYVVSEAVEEVDFKDYENVQGELERIMRQENRRKDAFAKQKAQLVAKLKSLEAQDLAEEFERSLAAPDNEEECEQLINQIAETNEYIGLEKDRIAKSTEDMQRIKDSFENRCIQTCSNIKTELDRLPQLSTITMDGNVISIIGLQIPYVKEELYKDRMAAYIDETVTAAESFKDTAERLQYIRNRLTWKRLFSVIVTDMNAIRVNLYKRERIGDQSRYLKYEEAVGSTGQSQGIYIQFLIAIINYISSINASAHEAAALGKTIFIDNPFGAAKDIYIWEPIFKLLKTNHVQLIVPARGATPAITGRFDVNYILGQKLVDKRQQTVVVDYQSRVEGEQLEYERIDYEQQTLNLL